MSLNSLSNQCCKTAFQAVRADHLECLAAMSKSDLSSRETSGQTPLHIAAKLNRLKIVDFLLKHVPETQNVISLYGENAILTAAAEGHFGVVRTLLSDGSLKTATMRAMHRDINGTSVLMLAVAYEDNDTAFWLLKRFGKALAMLPNKCLMLPLHVAAAQGNIEFIRVVTKYDSHMANFRDEFGCTACVYAIQCGSLLCLRYLVEKCRANLASVSDRGQSLLHVACLAGYPHIVQWILQRSVPNIIFWTTSHNANAIHFAAFSGCVGALRIMLKGIDKKRRKTVLALRDLRSNTPLHLTAINNHIEAAQYLLELGADPKLVNLSGQTPESIARIREYYELANLLQNWNAEKKTEKKSKPSTTRTGSVADKAGGNSSGYDSGQSQTLPTDASLATLQSPVPPQEEYISDYNNYTNGPEKLDLRPMKFITSEDDKVYTNIVSQTDPDDLTDQVQVFDSDSWQGEGLAAVEQIDKVLEEIDM